MLVGTIEYHNPLDDRVYKYNAKMVDNPVTMSLILGSQSYNAIQLMARPDGGEDDDALWERRCDIGLARVKVQTALSIVNDKKVKADINSDFFCRLGSLMRYAKSCCSKKNEDGFTGLALASNEFEASIESSYTIPFPSNDGVFAKVTLCYGDITSIHLEGGGFKVDLDTDEGAEALVFYSIKDGIDKGIKFDSDYLGFEVPAQDFSRVEAIDGMYTCIEDIVAAHPEKELSWLLEKDYHIVTDETLDEVCDYIYNWDGYVYYDTETTGLNINFKSRLGQADQLVGVVLSVKYGESFYFPTQMKAIPNLCGGDHFYFMEHYMRRILEGKDLVVHNLSFDWKVGYIYDINCNIVHDTMALLRLTLGSERKNYPIGLKDNAKIILKRDSLELSDLVIDDSWGESDVKFWDLPPELVRLYACADTDNTNGLLGYSLQADLLGKYNAKKIYEIELAFSYAVGYQEFYGHHIDINNIDTLREEIHKGQEDTMQKMVDIIGHEFNPNSPKQLVNILYGELGIPEQISRKTGRPTTDKETLQKLSELTDIEDNIKYPFVVYLQKYREYEGVRKIIDKFPEYVTQDGYIFSDVMQFGTTTGRVSIKEPNYQSYNDPVKKNIVPRPGFWMFDTDYSSVEYRVLGNMVGNEKIKENFKDPDFDYHAYQASHMYGVPYSAVTKKLRKAAKGINFGLPYGMGDESLGIRVFGEASPENTRKAASLRAAYFKGQEDIRDWFEFHRSRGVNEGFTETYFGRRRYYRRSDFSVAAIRRQAGNQVIQGCQSLDTRILTKEFGIVRLGDVLDLNVTVWDGANWSNGDVLPAGNKRKTIIKFKGGQTMVCSPNHKFLVATKRGGAMWVEAKDLHTTSEYRNPHRIVVNQQYALADYEYSSERKYDCYTDNAHNSYLDDIDDSYGIGVVLGRLASDGHQTLHHKGSNAIIQIIAEHEFNILPELREYMDALGYIEDNKEVRENRNEAITTLSVYSTSLAKEIDDLDIRHKIHKNIFMDTEVLRGFLCGYFDGDGGISGKAITCVFGKQDDFHILVEDMQKALMFFGVRSRIREYDDRWVLQIKTNDNEQFLKEIGFLNQDKQIAGSKLHCIEEEKIFGKCLIAESVEVTDELIPMADVCNTDGGYYVADGIITHNTAADIYKTAVGRVFKHICREGWLGKVLLSGFIHDELLGEVSNEINPAVFLKVLREEFEVKVTNPDGSPWCPLYMGFGYGTSWYEAKSVELPIKLQWEIVEKYGDTGFPNWDGDARKFCDGVPDMLREFEIRDIRAQLLDKDSQGKEIKPTLNNQVLGVCKDDSKIYPQAISDYITSSGDYAMIESEKMSMSDYLSLVHDPLCEYLDKTVHIQDLYKDEEGNYTSEFTPATSTQEAITQYCILHKTDRDVVNLLDIEEYEGGEVNTTEVDYFTDDFEDSEDNKQKIKDARIDNFGMYLDVDEKKVFLLLVPSNFMSFIQSHCNYDGVGYNVYFKDKEKEQIYVTKAYLDSKDIPVIQDMYFQYFKNIG